MAVETILKEKSKLDSHGFDLATKALSFEFDKKTGELNTGGTLAIVVHSAYLFELIEYAKKN